MSKTYNLTKRRTLELMAREPGRKWTVLELARLLHITPERRAYSYFLHLYKWQLIERVGVNGLVAYQITHRGVKRLAWLRAKAQQRTPTTEVTRQ